MSIRNPLPGLWIDEINSLINHSNVLYNSCIWFCDFNNYKFFLFKINNILNRIKYDFRNYCNNNPLNIFFVENSLHDFDIFKNVVDYYIKQLYGIWYINYKRNLSNINKLLLMIVDNIKLL